MEWDYPRTLKRIDYIETILRPHLFDLQARYHPDIWWFDGDWTRTMAEWKIDDFLAQVRAEGAITNDRLGKDHPKLAGDYQTYGDRFLPPQFLSPKWENVMTIGYSWGLNYEQTPADYKSGAELAQIYKQTVERGGNLLVNFGPDAEGVLDPNEVQSFDQMAALI
jgi:alpha-L-fucosidase